MAKFFVEEDQLNLEDKEITIIGDDVNHIKNVLRLTKDDKISISVKSSNPKNYIVSIKNIDRDSIKCQILGKDDRISETNIKLSIFQGIPKSDKMETIIQKCTEIGAYDFIPLEVKRCVAKIEKKDSIKKISRWQKIAEVAAKQSGRNIVPTVKDIINIEKLCEMIKDYELVIVAYEQEKNMSIKDILEKNDKIHKVAIVIGPEGGFEEKEIEILKNAGAKVISLGNRILRTETAPIVISSIIFYHFNEFQI